MTVKKLVMLFVIGLMMTFSINAQDAAPRDVQDLVGARAAGGETQLRSRGYTFIKTDEGNDRKYSNWWKQSTRTCINVVTMNGRYDTISSVPAFDCNRGNNSGGGNNDGNWGSVNPPSWARGTFYGTGPGGERITLTIDRNGSASARINNQSYSGNWSRGNHLIIAGGRSTVTRQGSSIVTTRVDNGERIVYSKTNSGGGYDPGSGGSNPPSWAQGTWYGTGPRGERITLVIGRDGNASANVNGGMSYGNWNRGNVLTIDGVRSNVRQQGGGIVTSTIGKNETITYSRSGWSGATNPGGGGYGDRVDLSDLVGDRASSAESQMRSRGFRNVDSFKTGNTAYTIWWRPVSRQCIQVAVANGRYDSVTDIGSHNRCR